MANCAGKQRRSCGFTELPVIVCRDWAQEQIRAFRLMANRSATWAEWDLEAVAQEIAELSKTDFDLKLTGFDAREIEAFLAPRFDEQALESAPRKPEVATSVRGDLWTWGNHRVLCGDSTSATDIDRLCASSVPVLMITDPPYGVHYDPQWREQASRAR